jgi:SAM-dependent methyltransferase
MTKLREFLGGRSMAEFYDSGWGPTALDMFAADLSENAAGGNNVLDLGCGTGVVTRYAASHTGPDARIVGLDPTPFMLEAARSNSNNADNIEWVEGCGEDMPFEDNSFDVVLCHQGWQYVTDIESTFREMKRVAMAGGLVAGGVWAGSDKQSSIAYLEDATGRYFGSEHVPLHAWNFGGLDELQKQAEKAGFEVTSLETKVLDWRFDSFQHLAYTMVAGAGRTDENGQLAMGLVDLDDPKSDQIADAFTADLEEHLKELETPEGLRVPFGSDILVARA